MPAELTAYLVARSALAGDPADQYQQFLGALRAVLRRNDRPLQQQTPHRGDVRHRTGREGRYRHRDGQHGRHSIRDRIVANHDHGRRLIQHRHLPGSQARRRRRGQHQDPGHVPRTVDPGDHDHAAERTHPPGCARTADLPQCRSWPFDKVSPRQHVHPPMISSPA
ncbi:hypothetical protein OG900_09085 [Streptomyces sp. NBC_00433]